VKTVFLAASKPFFQNRKGLPGSGGIMGQNADFFYFGGIFFSAQNH